MNNPLRSRKYLLLSATVFLVLLLVPQTQAQFLSSLFRQMESQLKSLKTLRANIVVGRYDPTLAEWTTSKGNLYLILNQPYFKSSFFKIDFAQPRKEIMLVTRGTFFAYTPGLKRVYTGSASAGTLQKKGGGIFSFLGMSRAELLRIYEVRFLGEEKIMGGKIPAWHLSFIPKSASQYKNAGIWVDGKGMILQVKIVPKTGDEAYFTLSGLEKNIKISPKKFRWRKPKGVRTIKV